MTLLTSIPEHWFLLGLTTFLVSLVWGIITILSRNALRSQLQAQGMATEQALQLQIQSLEQLLAHEQQSLQNQQRLTDEQAQQVEQLQQSRMTLSAKLEGSTEKLSAAERQVAELQEKRVAYEALLQEFSELKARSEAEQSNLSEQIKLLNDSKLQLSKEFEVLASRIFEEKQQSFTRQSQATIEASVNPLKDQLKEFRKRVEDSYSKEAAERNQLVGQITELQKQTQKIGADAINLANAIKGDNKAQGNWGEVILERLLEESGLQKGREYELQVSLKSEEGNRRNPDVIVRLPEDKDIVIDSKVSLVHYEKYFAAPDSEKSEYLKQHVNSLRTHIKQLSLKSYENLEGIRTLDFVFLFVPVESAFMLALQEDPGLFREAYDKHIVLVSPTTLLATLRTVENIWRYEKQNKNAEEIARQAGGLYDQFVLLLEAFDDIGKQIDKASAAYELTQKRLADGRGNLIGRVEKLRKLGAKTKKQLSQNDRALEALEVSEDLE